MPKHAPHPTQPSTWCTMQSRECMAVPRMAAGSECAVWKRLVGGEACVERSHCLREQSRQTPGTAKPCAAHPSRPSQAETKPRPRSARTERLCGAQNFLTVTLTLSRRMLTLILTVTYPSLALGLGLRTPRACVVAHMADLNDDVTSLPSRRMTGAECRAIVVEAHAHRVDGLGWV